MSGAATRPGCVPFSLGDLVRWTGGRAVRGEADARFHAVSIDTRTLAEGALFVAIRGPRHDAHDFLAGAVEAGAAGLLVEDGRLPDAALPGEGPVVAVPDTTRGLGALARGHREGFEGPVIALTGSSGKTTTKEMCAAILSAAGPCLKTEGNLNNEYGVPLTLLRRRPEHQRAVIEMGMNHRGEIARLVAIARPDVGLVTNVGTAHIEHLGSQEEIALEKGDLVAGLPVEGVAVLNADDPRVVAQKGRAPGPVQTYGREQPADVTARDVERLPGGRYGFRLAAPSGTVRIEVTGLGDTTVINALAAAAAALAAGVGLGDVERGLAGYRPIAGRLAPRPHPSGATIIDDSYNANPQSLAASLRALADLRGDGRAIAVLGDMGELGDHADEAHRAAGRLAGELGLDRLVAVGARARLVCEGARAAGLAGDRATPADGPADAAALLGPGLRDGDWVLVKGSRAMHMEDVVEALVGPDVREEPS